jgi:hypothetical protein
MENFLCPFSAQNNANICDSIPSVDYKKSWHAGGTGYIDGVRENDAVFTTSPVVKFIDEFGRSAIAMKYTVSCPDHPEGNNGEYAVTAFQRYSDSSKLWVFGGHSAHEPATRVGEIELSWLESLILNKKEKFTGYDYKDSSEYECSISLYGNLVQPNETQNQHGEL